ncbi:MBL fold metallo-hydrolase [Halomarina ordinaria]|uniref:MBL fold metallo-hydrolase n=1 Tax=Halomarina ordinaria TaxID=3033939 RepID=A0ABD5U7T4_9EURY|nr:lamin tail domain-containing protein [Halomarina sp. PSRA2]
MRGDAFGALLVCCLLVLAGCAGAPPDATGPNGSDAGNESETGNDTGTPAANGSASAPALGANGTLSVHYLNVGQGAATLLVSPAGETMLVDSGDYTDDGEAVIAALDRRGVDRVDHLVTTHADADHIGGHAAVIEHYETEREGVGAVYDPGIAASTQTYESYLDAVERHDVPLYRTQAGDTVDLAGTSVDVLGPPEGYLANRERNENSVVLAVDYGETTFLLPGDAETAGERAALEEAGGSLPTTVLAAGHHGSSSSTSEAFLDATDPPVAVVSSAYDSQYGHPHEETLERLAAHDVRTYWTATHGEIAVVSDGERAGVYTRHDAPTDPRSLREGEPAPDETTADLALRATVEGRAVSEATDDDAPRTGDDGSGANGSDDAEGDEADGEGALSVATIHADAAGDDRENLNDEYVVFENTGEASLDLSGWTVSDEAGKTYTVPEGVDLAPDERVTLRTGSGSDGSGDLYWNAGSPVWNNDGDTVVVERDNGQRALTESYA